MAEVEVKIWMGSPITRCDLCRCTITHIKGKRFVDGVVKGRCAWAIMCSSCYSKYGQGVGMGKGQMYEFDGANFVKIAG